MEGCGNGRVWGWGGGLQVGGNGSWRLGRGEAGWGGGLGGDRLPLHTICTCSTPHFFCFVALKADMAGARRFATQ